MYKNQLYKTTSKLPYKELFKNLMGFLKNKTPKSFTII